MVWWEAGLRSEQEYVEYVRARMPWLRRLAYRLCGQWSAADDLVQECLVALYRHWRKASAADSDRRVTSGRCWCTHTWRSGSGSGTGGSGSWPTSSGPRRRRWPAPKGRVDLLAALTKLSRGQRAVLVLRYWEDLDVAQTAAALGCSTGTVKSQTSYAIAALRRLLPNYVPGGSDTP